MTYRELYQQAKQNLTRAGKDNPAFDAFCLFSEATGLDRQRFVIHGGEEAAPGQGERLLELTRRRAAGEPLQYLLGEWEFMGLPFLVGEGVLVPRDDTEVLVEEGARLLRECGGREALDLCGGSGAVAVGLAHLCPQAGVVSVELSEAAFGYLEKNIARNRMERVSGGGTSCATRACSPTKAWTCSSPTRPISPRGICPASRRRCGGSPRSPWTAARTASCFTVRLPRTGFQRSGRVAARRWR